MKYLSYIFIFSVFLTASAQTITTPFPTDSASIEIKPFPITLKRSDANSFVSDLQNILKDDPSIYPEGLVTGYYGPLTENAVKKLQTKYGLPETGIVDNDTQSVLFPTKTEITVIAPNGSEAWNQLQTYTILWKASTGPFLKNGRTLIPETTTYAEPSKSAESPTSITMPEPPSVVPFFSRASIDLIRDSNPYFSYHIATAELYQSQHSWRIPASIQEGNDYRIRVSVGGNMPCVYRTQNTGSTEMMPPPPPSCLLLYPAYSASDSSDNPFSVVKAAPPPSDIIEKMKKQAIEIERIINQLLSQVRSFKSLLESL